MLDLQAAWRIQGVVANRRELTSKKSADWRGYVITAQCLGASYEVSVDAEQYAALKEGQVFNLDGHFLEANGRLRFVLDRLELLKKAS